MEVPVKIHKFVRYEEDGTKITGQIYEYKCLPNYEERVLINNKGKTVNTKIQLFFPRIAEIKEEDVVEFNGFLYDIKSLHGFYGSKHVGLLAVMV